MRGTRWRLGRPMAYMTWVALVAGMACVTHGAMASEPAKPSEPSESAPAPASPPPLNYELKHVVSVLRGNGLIPDRAPEGKTIAWIRTARFPVFIPEEPFPTFFNALHFTTTEPTILREVLLKPGMQWEAALAQETARNLRGMAIFNVVAVVPVRTADPAQIGLLVVTRDLWSLRTETRFQLTGGFVDALLVQLTERNLLGRDKRASLRFELEPLDFALGAVYVDPRLLGEPLRLVTTFDTRFERASGDYDGLTGYFELGRPLYDLQQRWGFSFAAQYEQYTERQAQRSGLLTFTEDGCDPAAEGADCLTAGRTWDHRLIGVAALGRIQRGKRWIVRVAGGAGFVRQDADANAAAALPQGDDPRAVAFRAAFADAVLPRERQWVYPTVNARLFRNRHQVYRDLAGFGLSEDVRLGPEVFVDLRLPLEAFGSSESLLDLGGSLVWREAWLGDGLVELAGGVRSRLWLGDGAGDAQRGDWFDVRALTRVRGATPSLGFGRVVLRADWLVQRAQLTPGLVTLGGHNGLRGYPSQSLFDFGADRLRGNVEYRTPPWVLSFLHFGAVAFFDAGALYDDLGDAYLHHSAGLGLRMVVPQASGFAYRLDFGVPTDGSRGFTVQFGFETSQAVPVTPKEDLLYDFSVGGLSNQP